jgi:hypothetical protein
MLGQELRARYEISQELPHEMMTKGHWPRRTNIAVLSNITRGYGVRNSLKAEDLDQPIKQCGGVVVLNSVDNAAITQPFAQIINI